MRYVRVVFLQGDEADEILDALCCKYPDSDVVYQGASAESIDAALETLKQWDYGDDDDVHDTPSKGDRDDFHETDEYLLSWNLGLTYVGLERKIA